jgi:mono/diheme cytochrome c family protein
MFRFTLTRAFVLAASLGAVAGVHTSLGAQAKRAHDHDQPGPDSWTLPPDAEQKKNPLTVDAKVLAQGKSIFKNKCQKCHGPAGKGDGPDADPEHQENMDLTRASRAAKNPDGVMFYKVTNGRKKPKMQAFKDQLTEEQIWAVVAYAQSLRK